tara:strand:- start:8333 stop:9058 length:726 start_codon:yes stop_codon:yes gene_type:complete
MKITKAQLQQIILEEYIKEEALEEALSPQQVEEMLAWIRKEGPKPDWLGAEYGHSKKGAHAPADPNVDRSAETMPIPSDDAPESEYQGFQKDSGPSDETYPGPWTTDGSQEENVQDRIVGLVQEMPPEEMLDLFTSVIEKLAPEYIELDRPPIGFREMKEMLNDVLRETQYDFLKGEIPPPHSDSEREELTLVQRIENAYHDLQDAFQEIEGEALKDLSYRIISDLQTLMDVAEDPEAYHE